MYIRLKNTPDIESIKPIFSEQNKICLYEKIKEDLSILDEAYRIDRSFFSYGGYVVLCLSPEDFVNDINSLCSTYHMDKDLFEFITDVWNDTNSQIMWKKVLYLLSSEDSLMIYYPTRFQNAG